MMETLLPFLQVIGGLAVLVLGGETLVRGAVAFANRLGVPPLVVGLTIVSFGTSAPELVISLEAVLTDHPDIALGNIIGSNIANILLVLGVTALIYPIAVDAKLVKRDTPLMMGATVLFMFFCSNKLLGRAEAAIFLVIIVIYMIHIFRSVRRGDEKELQAELESETNIQLSFPRSLIYIVLGATCLVVGSDILVEGAVVVARMIGVPEAVIGLTILAVGSSAPEMVTAVVAAYRRHADIALGNIVGSNLFNITVIGGTAAMVRPIPVAQQFVETDIWIMLAVTMGLISFMLTGRRISRPEGGILFAGYVAYNIWLYYNSLT